MNRYFQAAVLASTFFVGASTAQVVNEDFEIVASDAAIGDGFGNSVAISGTTAIVGARFDADAGTDSGSAYLFDTTTGQQLFKLTVFDAAADDSFDLHCH